MDLIERQAAIDALKGQISVTGDINAKAVQNYISMVNQRLQDLPPVQPDIIYCKDCKFHGLCRTSTRWAVAPKDDWYCANAERRTDDLQ